MHEPLLPMLFPVLCAHVCGSKFQYPDLTWKELCGQMANLVAESGGNKGQLSLLMEAICHNFRKQDEEDLKKLIEVKLRVDRGRLFPNNAGLFPNNGGLLFVEAPNKYIYL